MIQIKEYMRGIIDPQPIGWIDPYPDIHDQEPMITPRASDLL